MSNREEDPFKPLSAKPKKPAYSIGGRQIGSQEQIRAAKDRALLADIRRKKAKAKEAKK